MVDAYLQLNNVSKAYQQGKDQLEVLKECTFAIQPRQTVALVGPSGCGKSTLLQVAGLLDRFDSGEVVLLGKDVAHFSDKKRTDMRREHLGFVYQFHHLLPEFTALENVCMPLRVGGDSNQERAVQLLERVGLKERMSHRPSELSGGEKQRVALARALVHQPKLLIADEPTGNLDPSLAEDIFTLIHTMVCEHEMSALIATHNVSLADKLDKVVTLKEGKIHAA